jgi:hypothetical protein
MNKSYWNQSGTHQELLKTLSEMIPSEGAAENPHIDKLRLYCNAYYDLYNNGGCNPSRKAAKYFPGSVSAARRRDWDAVCEITEPKMDKVIFQVAKALGLVK